MPPSLHEIYARLAAHYGPQPRRPGETPGEGLNGAGLSQNASRESVEQALENLREAGALDVPRLHALPDEELAELIRSAGRSAAQARRLRNLLNLLFERYDGSIERMFAAGQVTLRGELLAI